MRTTRKSMALLILSAGAIAALLISTRPLSATGGAQQGKGKGSEGKGNDRDQPPPFYNPYPPGILPPDLVQEIERVRGEVRSIETEAIAQWQALIPPTLTNQPPILANTGMRANQLLGKLMNFDENMSPFKNRACSFCHMPYAGFSGPIPSVNLTMIA